MHPAKGKTIYPSIKINGQDKNSPDRHKLSIPATAMNKPTYRRPEKDEQLTRGLQRKFTPQPLTNAL